MYIRKSYPWIASILLHAASLLIPMRFQASVGIPNKGGSPVFELSQAPVEGSSDREKKSRTSFQRRPSARAVLDTGRRSKRRIPDASNIRMPLPAVKDEVPEESRGTENTEGALTAEFGWEGAPRSLLKRPPIRFPKVLGEEGLEAECEARITVSPFGTVVYVEITRSSGYTEIDASVESALRGYLFTRDYGFDRKNAVGNVRIRFRLEKPE